MLVAQTFIRRANRGRSAPPLCLAADEDNGEVYEIWLKSPGLYDRLPKAVREREWMASKAGSLLGLPVAGVQPVLVTEEFTSSLGDEDLRQRLEDGGEHALGSLHAGDGWRLFDAASNLPRSKLEHLESIVTFDCLIQNSDRAAYNPNLLRSGDDLILIDHEEAFSAAVDGYGSRPWTLDGMTMFSPGNAQHVLVSKLHPRSKCDFKRCAAAWKALDLRALAEYGATAPSTWDHGAIDLIHDYITEAQAMVDTFCTRANGIIRC